MTKKDNVESVMMCWASTESLAEKEYHEEPEKMANKLCRAYTKYRQPAKNLNRRI